MESASTLTTMTDKEVFETANKHLAKHYQKLPVNVRSGNGVWLFGGNGNRQIIDMMAQYSAAGFGRGYERDRSHPFFSEVVSALTEELRSGCGILPGFCYNETVAMASKALCEFTGMDRVVFMNSGAEAFDTAVKIARKWAHAVGGVDHGDIIVCYNNFHGRTLGAISASDHEQYRKGFGPLLPGFEWVRFGDIENLANAFSLIEKHKHKKVTAFLVEPLQAEGGINLPPDGYLQAAKELCQKHGALFVLDEIQTGFGRTGYNFAWEHDGPQAKPDLMILGKMLGGGIYPVSAVVGRDDVMSVLNPGDHGSTFGGTPLACAVVSRVIDIFSNKLGSISHGFVSHVNRMGAHLFEKLKEIVTRVENPLIKEVRGRGLLIGIEFTGKMAPLFQNRLLEEGVLAGVAGHDRVLRFSPPLIITREEIDWALPRIEKGLRQAT